jgi:uncharacterized protein (DUF58 family)
MLKFLRSRRSRAAAVAAAPAPAQAADAILKRLEWTVLRRLDGQLFGDYRTLFRGVGLDLADLREYQLHDDVRHIDWNVTARLQIPHVREYREDREVAAWFLVDLTASTDFGSHATSKQAVARDFVGLLARILTRRGNRVGLMIYGGKVDTVIPPGSGRRHVLRLLDRMLQRPAPEPGETDLAELLATAARALRRRALLFVVSDFISKPGWSPLLGQLAQRHETVAIRLYDPLENELPDLGATLMQDAETGEQLWVDLHDPAFRRRFAEAAGKRETALRSRLRDAGVDTLELSTTDDLVESLLRFADLRKQRFRVAAGGGMPVHLGGMRRTT